MKYGITGALLLGLVTVSAAQGQTEEMKKLEGTWNVVTATVDGKEAPADALKGVQIVFKGDTFSVRKDGKEVYGGTYKIDPTKSPPTMDTTVTSGEDKGKTDKGIYKLEGDMLTTVFPEDDKAERPKTFESKPGSKLEMTILKRAK
jgi:uncharacterized protein (TIGR03067 family)